MKKHRNLAKTVKTVPRFYASTDPQAKARGDESLDFARGSKDIEYLTFDKLKHIEHEHLLDESHLFANLNSLCTALGAQFIKQPA
jgi:hypothetical protein